MFFCLHISALFMSPKPAAVSTWRPGRDDQKKQSCVSVNVPLKFQSEKVDGVSFCLHTSMPVLIRHTYKLC